jgi:hypothetical protein
MYLAVELNLRLPLITFSTAARKSFSFATFRRARIANIPASKLVMIHDDIGKNFMNIPASVHTLRNSAPVLFGHNREINSHLISRSTLMLLA